MNRRAAGLLLLGFLLFASLHCRRAGGAASDPVEREAEDALVHYIRIDTTPGRETAGAVFLRDLLVREGIDARLVGDDPKRQAVYARLTSGTDEKALLLLSHIDVVPVDAASWTHPPFGGVRAGGYIWGRGALDDKSLTIAQLMAMVDLKRRGARLRRDVVFLAVPDEELGGLRGTKMLLERHPELFAGVGHVINEGGTNQTAIDQVLFWGIEIQQKVPLWLRVTSESSGGHGALPPEQGSASVRLVRALSAIDGIETPYRLNADVARVAAASAAVWNDARAAPLREVREPLDAERIARMPPSYRPLLRNTIAITRLSATTTAVNVMPARAVGELDIRLLPDERPEPMIARITELVGDNGTVEVLLAGEPVPASPIGGELYDTIARAMRASEPASVVGPIVMPGTTDSRFFRARGIPTYGIMPMKVNYYDVATVHANDERIRARFFSEGVRLMRTIVRDFCVIR